MSYLNSAPQIYLISKFCKTTKIPKFGTKDVLLGCFWATTLKKYCHVWNQHSQFCLIAKNFVKKQKDLNLDKKFLKCLFWDWSFKKLLSYLESTSSNLSNCRIFLKIKHNSIWAQKFLIWLILTKNVLF